MKKRSRKKVINAILRKIKEVIRVIARVATYTLLFYVLVWGVKYAIAQRVCLGYEFETTEMTYDFQPFCVGLYQGRILVLPVDELIQIETNHDVTPNLTF